MSEHRKRRIGQLIDILENNLKAKRAKIAKYEEDLWMLELPVRPEPKPLEITIPQHIHKDSSSRQPETKTDDDSVVVSLPLSPSRKSSRLQVASPIPPSSSALSGRKEANVLARVAQLQKEGKWPMGKKLIKLQPPQRPKTHWDFVIEEMVWLSGVFQQELKMKKSASKKCARMVQKHFTDKALAIQRAERAQEQQLRRIASFMAKEVRGFWGNIEKLFEFRLKSQIERKRKQAMDEHLNFIVDRTEKYSTMLAESMAESASMKTTPTGSDSEMGAGYLDDDDYEPDQNSDDDEGTIAKDEDAHEDDELDLLKAESDIPVEDLLRLYHPELYGSPPKVSSPKKKSSAKNDHSKPEEMKEQELDEESDDDDGDDEGEEKNGDTDLKALVTSDEEKFSDVIEMASKFQPTGNTLDTTSVKTKVPPLLKGTLREYQHIGLDWLVSLHERKLNGILADEMGLGKTIQTISLLCHLACEKHIWGPHLVVVPTSVMLNWEMELKKWAPGFKVLTYYGSQKERRLKRVGWTKPNAFHVCITSYKLVIQDHQSFRRKRWVYLILDEAQHIKNFKSQRWQLLLNFASEGRLLLTGTPLQNNLMELWSLMHFLMPNVFESHRDFKEWFSNPLTGMVEGSAEYNESLIQRLHKVLRPFLLRRLKNEVEKQLPKKYEHIVKCPLSKRQRFLYDDFMSRAKTKETLESGNLLSVINILMQLRKVCNHPNLFEPRPTIAPFVADPAANDFPLMVGRALEYDPYKSIDLKFHPLVMSEHEFHLTAFAAFRLRCRKTTQEQFETGVVWGNWRQPIVCPKGKLRLAIRTGPSVGLPKPEPKIPLQTLINNNLFLKRSHEITIKTPKGVYILCPKPDLLAMSPEKPVKPVEVSPRFNEAIDLQEDEGSNPKVDANETKKNKNETVKQPDKRLLRGVFSSSIFRPPHDGTPKKMTSKLPNKLQILPELKSKLEKGRQTKAQTLTRINDFRCSACPLYGKDLIESSTFRHSDWLYNQLKEIRQFNADNSSKFVYSMNGLVTSKEDLIKRLDAFTSRFHLFVSPCVVVRNQVPVSASWTEDFSSHSDNLVQNPVSRWTSRLESQRLLQLPETRLIQYDCGKLQVLGRLLHKLKDGGHRVLLFTQMTKVLDVLESFMNFQGHTYLRLDGSTKVEQRQILMERFNANSKYFCFILSTRSGGVGVNLTGADTVIFYDSDWNPTMDAQAQDRCHRIGQTRDVHIYRLISERSVEENILKKASQKRLLGDIAIEGGNFTTAHLKKSTIRDLFEVDESSETISLDQQPVVVEENLDDKTKNKMNIFESALAVVEENTDVEAMNLANQEAAAEEAEFNEDGEKEDDKFGHLMKQLTSIERYALAQVEYYEGAWKREQLAAADAEIEAQRREFDAKRLEEMPADTTAAEFTGEEESSDDDDDDNDDQEEEEESDEGEENNVLASPRTRSRGDVAINLWKLDKNKQHL